MYVQYIRITIDFIDGDRQPIFSIENARRAVGKENIASGVLIRVEIRENVVRHDSEPICE